MLCPPSRQPRIKCPVEDRRSGEQKMFPVDDRLVRNSDLPCARGEWPVLIEPIKAAANGRFRESARQRGANDVDPRALHSALQRIVLHPHRSGLSAEQTLTSCVVVQSQRMSALSLFR